MRNEYILKDNVMGGGRPYRFIQMPSVASYCNMAISGLVGTSHRRVLERAHQAETVRQNGWPEVLPGLVRAKRKIEGSLMPVKKTVFSWSGGMGVNMDRYYQAQPCMVSRKRTKKIEHKFVRVMFLAEAFGGCPSDLYVKKITALLETIISLENQGRQVEVLMTFGAYLNHVGIIDGCVVKSFNQRCDLLALSAIGHPSFFTGAHFGMENVQRLLPTDELPNPNFPPGGLCPLFDKKVYSEIFSRIWGKDFAESMVIIDHYSLTSGDYKKQLDGIVAGKQVIPNKPLQGKPRSAKIQPRRRGNENG